MLFVHTGQKHLFFHQLFYLRLMTSMLCVFVAPCRIEETWRLWCKFLEDYARFEDWLSTAERTAANPASTDILYTCAKEELKKFEVSFRVFISL